MQLLLKTIQRATRLVPIPRNKQFLVRVAPNKAKRALFSKWAEPTPEDAQTHAPERVFEAGLRHHHTANTAYPIAHAKTLRPYRVPRYKDQTQLQDAIFAAYRSLDEIMLYVHVPFCEQRCQFCEYTVVNPAVGKETSVQDHYFDALMGEFDLYRDLLATSQKKLVGFDIGGGTPSMASIHNIQRVMEKMEDTFDFDPSRMAISIETTPRIASSQPDKIRAYFDMGIRRISMGVQTTDFALAKRLGRNDEDYLTTAVKNIRDAGFESFNIDLMYGFPLREGTRDKWADTIKNTIQQLEPDHITLYRMRYKGTKMSHLQERVGLQQVNTQAANAVEILADAGYKGWVGKNTFSRVPSDSGCSDYLEKRVVKGIPYLGLGLGAQSFSHSTLAYNLGGVTKQLHQYQKSVELGRLPIQDLYHLSASGAWGKFCSVSFYFGGIDLPSFQENFGLSLFKAYPDKVAFAMETGLMELQEGGRRLQLTPLGKSHYSGVLALFYAPHVQKHLMELPGGEANATEYMAAGIGVKTTIEPSVVDPKRPYVGNPLPRYERKRMNRKDPRAALPSDWTEANPVLTPHETTRRRYSTLSTPSVQPEREPTKYEFGNILFGGSCNQKCIFCIGQQLPGYLSPRNHRDWPLKNLDRFVEEMIASDSKRVILTGTTTDPQLYKHEAQLIKTLRTKIPGSHISVHTNGLLALRKVDTFNLYDTATISINSFDPVTFAKIHGVSTMPDIGAIVANTKPSIKLSCVLTPDNVDQVEVYIETAARLGVTRIALRPAFCVQTGGSMPLKSPKLLDETVPNRFHCGNPVFDIGGVEVTYWKFDKTSGKSLNLFANGLLSKEYLLSKAPLDDCSSTL